MASGYVQSSKGITTTPKHLRCIKHGILDPIHPHPPVVEHFGDRVDDGEYGDRDEGRDESETETGGGEVDYRFVV